MASKTMCCIFSDYISPICLPTTSINYYDRKKPKVTGWGRTTSSQYQLTLPITTFLQQFVFAHVIISFRTLEGGPYSQMWEMEVITVPNSKCSENYVEFIQRNEVVVDEKVICGMRPGMKDACLVR